MASVYWVADSAVERCKECRGRFSLFVRRHHCRLCGHIYCSSCTKTTRVAAECMPGKNAVRVCQPCAASAGWTQDEDVKTCYQCQREFTIRRRRHHCRRCGKIFCGRCSVHRQPLPTGEDEVLLARVCDACAALPPLRWVSPTVPSTVYDSSRGSSASPRTDSARSAMVPPLRLHSTSAPPAPPPPPPSSVNGGGGGFLSRFFSWKPAVEDDLSLGSVGETPRQIELEELDESDNPLARHIFPLSEDEDDDDDLATTTFSSPAAPSGPPSLPAQPSPPGGADEGVANGDEAKPPPPPPPPAPNPKKDHGKRTQHRSRSASPDEAGSGLLEDLFHELDASAATLVVPVTFSPPTAPRSPQKPEHRVEAERA
eukprot:Sspe_Gene.77898::Locus_48708_Transcript_1_1_Confidence_1.000_Length_1322::g.77898::m.77898